MLIAEMHSLHLHYPLVKSDLTFSIVVLFAREALL